MPCSTNTQPWFQPLFAAPDWRNIGYLALLADGHAYDPADTTPPAPLVFNRIAMSSFLRQPEHPIVYTPALMAHWAHAGAHLLNGAETLAIKDKNSPYVNFVVGPESAKADPRVHKLVAALRSPEVKAFIAKK